LDQLAIVFLVIYGAMIVIGLPFILFSLTGLRRRVSELETELRSLKDARAKAPPKPRVAAAQAAPEAKIEGPEIKEAEIEEAAPAAETEATEDETLGIAAEPETPAPHALAIEKARCCGTTRHAG